MSLPRAALRFVVLVLLWATPFGLVLVLLLNVSMIVGTRGRCHADLRDLPEAPLAIVLGTGAHTPFLEARLDAAAALYHAGKAPRLLLSGSGSSSALDEIGPMRQGMLARGVPAAALEVDPEGRRTFASLRRAKEVFGASHLIVVSQRFHNYRALFLADHLGLDAQAFDAPTPAGNHRQFTLWREAAARVRAVLDVVIG